MSFLSKVHRSARLRSLKKKRSELEKKKKHLVSLYKKAVKIEMRKLARKHKKKHKR